MFIMEESMVHYVFLELLETLRVESMKSRFPAEKYALKGEERRKKMGSNGQTFNYHYRFHKIERVRYILKKSILT